ncbi:MAG: hypothetical protein OXF97_11675 [Nitrospira sp.]|nr:hypothetical protein [Nitrospira sp.]
MRTTLNIDTELLAAAKQLAERENKTAGQVISELLRQALSARAGAQPTDSLGGDLSSFQPVPSRGGVVTNEQINALREELGV